MKKFIIRQPKPNETAKIERLILTALPTANVYLNTLILTVPKPNGEKGRYIVGCVSMVDGKICQLVVSEAYRRQGLGTELVKAAIAQIKTQPWLRVRMWNWKAIRMYWKLGFRITGIHRHRSFTMAIPSPSAYSHTGESRVIVEGEQILKPLYPANRRERKAMSKALTFDASKGAFVIPATIPDLIQDEQLIEMTLPAKFDLKTLAEAYYSSYTFKTDSDYDTYRVLSNMKEADWNVWETSEGRWITRFSKYLHKKGIKLSAGASCVISTIVFEMLGTSKVYIQLCTRFHPSDKGKFGDPNSCWYGDQGYHPRCLFSGGHGYTFKVYDENKKGISRAWLYYTPDTLIMFNGRGRLKARLPELLSAYLGLPHKEGVRVEFGGDQHGHYTDGDYVAFSTKFKSNYVMRWCDGPTIRT